MILLNPYIIAPVGGGGGYDPRVWAHWQAESMSGIGNGATAPQWDDLSGNARHAVQATGGVRPTKRNADIGGKASFDFTPSLAWFDVPDASALTEAEIFLLFKRDANPPTGGDGDHNALYDFGTDTLGDQEPYSDSNFYDGFGTTARKAAGNPGLDVSDWFMYNVITKAGEWSAAINQDAPFYTTGTNTVGFKTTPMIGNCLRSGPTRFGFKGRIAEIVLLSEKVTAPERAAMWDYISYLYFGGAVAAFPFA